MKNIENIESTSVGKFNFVVFKVRNEKYIVSFHYQIGIDQRVFVGGEYTDLKNIRELFFKFFHLLKEDKRTAGQTDINKFEFFFNVFEKLDYLESRPCLSGGARV
jgi:hypothetical protein